MYGETFYGRHTAQHQLQCASHWLCWFQSCIKKQYVDEDWLKLKEAEGSYKKLYDIKCIILALKLYRGGI